MTELRVSKDRLFTIDRDGDRIWLSMGGNGLTAGGMYTKDDIRALVENLALLIGQEV